MVKGQSKPKTQSGEEMKRLNVGCGKDIKEGWINIDTHKTYGADLIHRLPKKLPFKKESIDKIYCAHVLEDFGDDYLTIMWDFHRILKKGGELHIIVPFGLSVASPMHKRFFDMGSFNCFVRGKDHYEKGIIPRFSKYKLRRLMSKERNTNGFFMKLLTTFINTILFLRKYEVEVIIIK